ncbi:MAG: DUF4124 domain-containing protein [Granulosicoccus sp.]
MIRLLSFIVLSVACSIVLAQPLYKWVEPDGSITFSVTPPAAGISYENVTTPSSESSLRAATPKAEQAAKAPSLSQALPDAASETVPAQRLAPQQNVQTRSQSNSEGIQGTRQDPSVRYSESQASRVIRPSANSSTGENQNAAERSVAINARSRKQRQCEDLQKRVISLERRLKTRLTPEDMDNTVVHMARYQRSYDQHCVQ